jgi:peroxiredoxin
MKNLEVTRERAPDFEAQDTHGGLIRLSDFRGRAVVLAFLRGFA